MKKNNGQSGPAERDQTRWSETPYLLLKGFLMGTADIIPGVSGGTLALITGIYDRLIFAIKSVDSKAIANILTLRLGAFFGRIHWRFLLLVLSGIGLAVVFFTRVVPLQVYMYTHPEIVYGLFFGLILGSIFLLLAEIDPGQRNRSHAVPLLGGALFGFWVVTLVPADTPETFWYVMATGSVAICAMILPGISGSYILLIFRKYEYILAQIGLIGSPRTVEAALNLLPFVLGAVAGLALFSRVLSWLLKRYHAVTMMVLIGFLAGSLYVIWPYQEREMMETVRSTEVLPVSDPLVRSLMERDELPEGPDYRRLGRVLGGEDNRQRVEVETVSRKIVSSTPFFPWGDRQEMPERVDRAGGIAGMAGGLILIIGISYLRRKT